MKYVYLDNAATTPIDEEVIEYMTEVLKFNFGNPSSIHAAGRTAKNTIEQARKKIAGLIGASPAEIVFTSGGTEANNMALKCSVRDMGVRRIISTPIEHHCVLHTLDRLDQDVQIELLEVNHLGEINLDQLEQRLQASDEKTLVSIMYANNEIGTVYPVTEIAKLCNQYQALNHSDSVQAIGHFPINVSEWPVHFLSGAAHKFHGPKGIGFLFMNSAVEIAPFIDGGAQERNMRAGTENIVGIAGMALALEKACSNMTARRQYISDLRNHMINEFKVHFDDVEINGQVDDSGLYTVLSVSFPPTETSSMLLMQLDIKGICVSSGSACSSGSNKSSHVIDTIRPSDEHTTIRFSFSHLNTKQEIDFTLEQLRILLPQQSRV